VISDGATATLPLASEPLAGSVPPPPAALAGALLEVFGVVVVTSEAVENLCDARLSFFSLRGCVVSSLH